MTLLDADIKRDPVLGEDTWDLFETIECSFGIDLGDYRSHCGRTIRDLAADVERIAKYPNADKRLTRSPSTGCAEHCSNSLFHEVPSVQRRLCANCCHGGIDGGGGNKCEIS